MPQEKKLFIMLVASSFITGFISGALTLYSSLKSHANPQEQAISNSERLREQQEATKKRRDRCLQDGSQPCFVDADAIRGM